MAKRSHKASRKCQDAEIPVPSKGYASMDIKNSAAALPSRSGGTLHFIVNLISQKFAL
jgi:hypothetical protein